MKYIIRAAGLSGFRELVTQLGADPDVLLQDAGFPAGSLDNEDNLIDCRLSILLLEKASNLLQCPDFGLQMSARQDVSVLGPLSLALRHSATVGEGFECAAKYLFVHSNGFSLSIRHVETPKGNQVEIRFDLLIPDMPLARQFWDTCLAVAIRVFKLLTNSAFTVNGVYLPHKPIAPLSKYRKVFGDVIYFEQTYAALIVDEAALRMPLKESNLKLKDIGVHYLNMHYTNSVRLSDKVRAALMNTVETHQDQLDQIAELFNMHSRALQRRLMAEGTTFEILRDETKRDAAKRYLTSTQVPLSQIASMLGMSEQSSLTRACKRWFGATPKSIRKQVQ